MQISLAILFLCSFFSLRVLARPALKTEHERRMSTLLGGLEEAGEQAVSGLIKAATAIVTRNQVLANGSSCADMTVLFARGTDEPGKQYVHLHFVPIHEPLLIIPRTQEMLVS